MVGQVFVRKNVGQHVLFPFSKEWNILDKKSTLVHVLMPHCISIGFEQTNYKFFIFGVLFMCCTHRAVLIPKTKSKFNKVWNTYYIQKACLGLVEVEQLLKKLKDSLVNFNSTLCISVGMTTTLRGKRRKKEKNSKGRTC